MLHTVNRFAATATLLLSACATGQGDAHSDARSGNQSAYTSLSVNACKSAVDETDPDETPYLVCPGVGGYALQVRQVDSGRSSISVVNPAKQEFPLNYQDFVTRSMSSLNDKAEWRVRREREKTVPVALIVRVMAHESQDDPEKVTNTYIAVAKISVSSACVTNRIRLGAKATAEVQAMADSAASRPCAPALPPAN